MSKVRRASIAALALILLSTLLLAIPAPRRTLKRGWAKIERTWLIVTGGLVDVGGYRIRIKDSGRGNPTVIMDAGLCQTMDTWGRVPSDVSAFARVYIFDRAGLGGSDRGPQPRTSRKLVEELHTLLKNGTIRPPYVLVGHSFGGLNVRLFASVYPDEVVGLVLVDSTHENQRERYRPLLPKERQEEYLKEDKGNCERVDLIASAAEVRAAAPFRAMPLVVLSAAMPRPPDPRAAEMEKANREMQADLVRLAPRSKHIVLEDSGHFIQITRPDAVVNAIRDVVEAARGRRGL